MSSTIALTPPTDSLGCVSHKLHPSLDIAGDGIKFYRRRTDDTQLGQVATPASDRGFLVGISLGNTGHRRQIFHGHHSSTHDFHAGSVYVRSFLHDYRADLRGPFDFLLVEISEASLKRAIDERPGTRVRGLDCVTGHPDPVLSNLACALAPALARPAHASRVFVEQMGTVIETYLLEQYGGASATPRRQATSSMSRANERRAKDMLLSRLDGNISIADIANACALSRSHFIRTFRNTTGQTPHQWLQAQRIERARHLLRTGATSIADIATQCGFADQSHFTRVFTQWVGTTPGRWRREVRS
ncbi:MAG: AraC family transcriptional regulator [Rubrivivax sp.]|nr:MAG: AraC family transcriptional regulator [Rubrivivax sp.]